MTHAAQDIIKTFDRLPADEQKEVIKIILRRNTDIETPVLSDEELILNAEEIFLELDRREAEKDAES
jgi:hypothetical protein